jgi:thiol:disulfide interchange protein
LKKIAISEGVFVKLIALFSLVTAITLQATIEVKQHRINDNSTKIEVVITPETGQAVFKDFITLTVDHPGVTLSPWASSETAQSWFDASLQKELLAFTKPTTLYLHATKISGADVSGATLHISYLTSHAKTTKHEIVPLSFAEVVIQSSSTIAEPTKTLCSPSEALPTFKKGWSFNNVSEYLEQLITASQALWIRLLLIMLLGLLMSLTPCIYPMIPITIGIMQGQGQKSVLKTFAHAAAYSMGIATTFALLGLFAASTGAIFGMLLTHPAVVLVIVSLMIYMALSLFGFYEMRMPQFLLQNNTQHRGSLLSSFAFGAISGTVASPCLSPGLALVLCIVASIGNKFIGFLLLFAFGIGLSIPLLIIGTASGSLGMLPRAGAWMVEIKKIFGFLLFGMAFYYLKNIVPWDIMLWMIALFTTSMGIYYLLANSDHNKWWRRIKNLIGTASIAASVLIFFEAYQTTFLPISVEQDNFWLTDYETARELARKKDTYLFLDFWAPSCSICTAIDKTLLKEKTVRAALAQTVPVKIELVMNNDVVARLKEKFNIIGLPTFLLVDPVDEKLIHRWGGELYHASAEAFSSDLLKLIG